MKRHPMKPETIARRHAEAVAAKRDRDLESLRRAEESAKERPDSIWPELLSEQRARLAEQYKLPLHTFGSFRSASDALLAQANALRNGLPIYLQDDNEDN